MAGAIYPQLAQLAPTLLYGSTDWRGFYGVLAGITGKQDEIAEQLLAFDARLAGIKARVPVRTVSVLRITSWDFQVYLDAPQSYAPFEIMKQAGVKRSAYEVTDDPSLSMKRPDWRSFPSLTARCCFTSSAARTIPTRTGGTRKCWPTRSGRCCPQ